MRKRDSILAELEEVAELRRIVVARNNFWEFCKYIDPGQYNDSRPHLKIVAQELQDVADGKTKRLGVSLPPRGGKSYIASDWCGWMLGRDPMGSIMRNTYAATLAEKFSKDIRDGIIVSARYRKVFPEVKLSKKNTAVDAWSLAGNTQPSYFCAGVGGAITGFGCKTCLPAGEMVYTNRGLMDIEKICQESQENNILALSYNHKYGIMRYNQIKAKRMVISHELVEITTESGKLRCTPNHRVWNGTEYVEARILRQGDRLYNPNVRLLRDGIQQTNVRTQEETENWRNKSVLLQSVFWKGVFAGTQIKLRLRCMRNAVAKAGNKILFAGLQRVSDKTTTSRKPKSIIAAECETVAGHRVSNMSHDLPTEEFKNKVLLSFLRGSSPLKRDSRDKQSELSSSRYMASEDEFKNGRSYTGTRRLGVRSLQWQEKTSHASFGREPSEQCGKQSNNALLNVPYRTPQITPDVITKIERVHGEVQVYDIEVARDSNFFASNFLVHNCAILDDPIKNIEEALSEITIEAVWNWYTSTHLSRLETGCPEILIATRWSKKDPIGRLTDPDSEYYDPNMRVVVIPALDENGNSFCEAVKTTEEYHEIRRITDPFIWEAEFMQNPIEEKGLLFPPTELKRFSLYRDDKRNLKEPDGVVGYTDTADLGSDFLCSLIGERHGEFTYITDVVFSQDGVELTEPKVADLIIRNKCQYAEIESNNGGRQYARNVKRMLDEKKYQCSLNSRTNTKNKETRIITQAGYIKEYFYFRSDYMPGSDYDKYMRQLTGYVKLGRNSHDDACDATTGLSEMIPYRHFAKAEKPKEKDPFGLYEPEDDYGITSDYLRFMDGEYDG